VADVDRVIRIFNALLRLAEIDTGMRRSGFVPVSAADIARQAVDFYLPAAELKGISLSYGGKGPADISGDPVLLAQALGNLIDNALKYTSDGGLISVEVQTLADGNVWISVADDGPGIADEEKPKVPTRFYRGDASRGTPGVGLGLTLVESVAKLHGGVLELADNNPGLRVHMIIPAQAAGALKSARPQPGAVVEPPAVTGSAAVVGPAAAAGQHTPAGAPEVTVPSGAAEAAHNLRIRSVS
jgi:signal transduction histidine kinase